MHAMRPTASKVSRAVPALLAAAVVSIVLGIVGMHALNIHGSFGNTDHSDMTGQETGQETSQATGQVTGAHGDMSAGAIAGDHPEDEGHSLGGMVMLCFAMLAAGVGALVLLLLGLRRRPRVWTHRLTAAPSVSRWVTARLGTGPPYAWEFSVIRC